MGIIYKGWFILFFSNSVLVRSGVGCRPTPSLIIVEMSVLQSVEYNPM